MKRYLKSSEDNYLNFRDEMADAILDVCERYIRSYQRRGFNVTENFIRTVLEQVEEEVIDDWSYENWSS